MTQEEIHNTHAPFIMTEIVNLCGRDTGLINLMVQSLLLGAGTFSFPHDHRRQAMMIQYITNGAIDRVAKKPEAAL